MKKLIYLLLAVPFAFTACTEPNEPNDPQPEVKEPVLTLLSESEIVFENEGDGVIEYSLENAPEGALPTATSSANWIDDIKVAEKITFHATYPEPYLMEDVEAVIKVEYESKSFEVTVKCLANEPEATQIEFCYMDGQYYAPGYWNSQDTNHNFFILLSTAEDISAYTPNNHYLQLDLWAATGDEEAPVIPNGTYTIDPSDSCAAGTIGYYYSELKTTDANNTLNTQELVSGSITVNDNEIEGTITTKNGEIIKFVYNGTTALPIIEKSNIEVNGNGYTGYMENYGDYYDVGADNYIITLIENSDTNSGQYITLDIIVSPESEDCNGEFTVLLDNNDVFHKYVPGYIADGRLVGCWYAILEDGYVTDVYRPLYDGTITITDNGDGTKSFTFDCVDDDNYTITGSITATVEEVDASAQTQSLGKAKVTAPSKSFGLR